MSDSVRGYWDLQAATFDEEPDHGLRDPDIRASWRTLLLEHLPPAPADITDLGCGTGTLAVLLAQEGYRVRGLDIADAMVAAATAKARQADVAVAFQQGDAAAPPYVPGSCDAVLCRHVLWAMPDRRAALERWIRLLRPGGLLVLVEGHWSTGAGLTADACAELVLGHRESVVIRQLSESCYWGRAIGDERYLAVSHR